MKQILLTIGAIFCLVVAILTAGIVVCFSVPQITDGLSRATALVDTAHFTRDQLVDTANKTRAFVAGDLNKNDIYEAVKQINEQAHTEYAGYEAIDFAAVNDEFALDSVAMTHLEDVQSLFANIRIALGMSIFGFVLFGILLFVFCGRSPFGRVLVWSGLIVIIGLGFLIGWSFVSFDEMFNTLHSFFFKEGSWLFSDKSLLIAMYPTPFWIGMAVISFGISIAASIVAIIIGKIIK